MIRQQVAEKAKPLSIGIIILTGLLLTWAMAVFLPPAVDWHTVFRPASLAVLSGGSPYSVDGFFYVPWSILPLLPLAFLPENIGRALLVLLTFAGYFFVARRLGAKTIAIVFLLLSPIVLHEILNGNIDWLAVLGFVFPPQIGLFFIVIKPQVGVAVGLFWFVQSWRSGGWRNTVRVFAPVALAIGLSIIIYGWWFLPARQTVSFWWNASLWPMSIPVGLALLVAAIRKGRIEFAMGASPCLSPYVLFHSWVGALLAIVNSVPETIAAVIGLWILVGIRFYG